MSVRNLICRIRGHRWIHKHSHYKRCKRCGAELSFIQGGWRRVS